MAQIVTDGLVLYWNSKQGVEGSIWKNIAPETEGRYDAEIIGATVTEDGMYFDGVDDIVSIFDANIDFDHTAPIKSSTLEFIMKLENVEGQIIDFNYNPTGMRIYMSLENDYISAYFNYSTAPEASYSDYILAEIPYTSEQMYVTVTLVPNEFIKIYINNEEIAGLNLEDKYLAFNEVIYVDIASDWGWTAKGIIDSIRLYDRLLSLEEIQQNYAVGMDVGLLSPEILFNFGGEWKELATKKYVHEKLGG